MKYFLIVLFTSWSFQAYCCTDTSRTQPTSKRLVSVIAGTNLIYAGGLIYVSKIWYSKKDRTSFHFFNDLPEWKQMDKVGHSLTSFHECVFFYETYKWTGLSPRKADIYASIAGFLYQAPIEIFDGFGKSYGASVYDLGANLTGSVLYLSQKLTWNEIRIFPKISFHQTQFPQYRPSLLGKNLKEQMLKDYNGQTYWLSFNISSFLKSGIHFPKCLNLSLGYGAEGMVYGRDEENKQHNFYPYRQYYLSFDIDFRKIKSRYRIINIIKYPLNIVHIPFPAVEFNKKGVIFHPIYF